MTEPHPAGLPHPDCGHTDDDAAFVLGALTPDDRVAFERHLPGCPPCTRSVSELAGLPGLMSRVSLEQIEPGVSAVTAPDTLLPGLVRRVRDQRRRRTALTAGLTAGLVVAGAAAAVVVAVTVERTPTSPAGVGGAPAVAMHPVGDDPVAATLSLTAVGWGTRLELTCDERAEAGRAGRPTTSTSASTSEPASYAMYVHTRDGRVERVATWQPVPGGVVHVSGATATARSDITDVDVRDTGGVRVLDLR